jgi:hypothetical protein
MERAKRSILNLLIILTSLFIIDGGRSILLNDNNIQILFSKDYTHDIDIPHQHIHLSLIDEEKWIDSFKFDFPVSTPQTDIVLYSLNWTSQEFLHSIWQPPRVV